MVSSRSLGNRADSRGRSCKAGSRVLSSMDSSVRTCTDNSVRIHTDTSVRSHTDSIGYRNRLGDSLDRKDIRELHLTSRRVLSSMRLVVLPQAIPERDSISYLK